jgi:hypothetical protein
MTAAGESSRGARAGKTTRKKPTLRDKAAKDGPPEMIRAG